MSSILKLLFLTVSVFVMVLPCSADQVKQVTGKNVLVLFKQNDSLSKKIADYYLKKRAVPKSQLVGIKLSTANNSTISPSQFADIQQQIKPYLTDQIKVLLLTWHAPYRVGCMSITSAFSLGFDENIAVTIKTTCQVAI